MSTFPTDAEREVINRVLPDYLATRQVLIAALAPLVADRERAAAARSLREMADDLGPITHGRTSVALSHWTDHDRGIYELAIEEASGKIHERADALEADR